MRWGRRSIRSPLARVATARRMRVSTRPPRLILHLTTLGVSAGKRLPSECDKKALLHLGERGPFLFVVPCGMREEKRRRSRFRE